MESRRKPCSIHSASKCLTDTPFESGLDKKIGELILEYVLRQCDDNFIISGLIRALPVSNENLRLKKMILLKSISSDLSKGIISQKTLEFLQSLKDLNMQICRDSNSEKSMQDLCCKVAVECTVKCLRGTCKINWDDYNDALSKLWTCRAQDTEDIEMDGAVIDVKKELLTVASNHTLRESLLEKYKQDDVFKCLDAFLKDSWEQMGPSNLEIAFEDVVQGSYNLLAGQDLNHGAINARMAAPSCETGDPACIVPDNNEETTSTFPPPWADFHPSAGPDISKDKKIMAHNLNENQAVLSKTREAGNSSVQPLSDRRFPDCQPITIDLEEMEITRHDDPVRKEATAAQEKGKESEFNLNDVNAHKSPRLRADYIDIKQLTTPEYGLVKENLRRSNLELHALVEDPLPNALKVAESCAVREECFPSAVHLDGKKHLEKQINEVEKTILLENNTSLDNQAQNLEERKNGNQSGKSGGGPGKFNIMNRNPTACTFQWDEQDTIDSEQAESPSASRKIHLPTPVRKHVSPLKRPHTSTNISYRRKPTKWSLVEEETLKKEVAKYGKGRWKYILEKHRTIFEERTEVDLKDKWRNIERREGLCGP